MGWSRPFDGEAKPWLESWPSGHMAWGRVDCLGSARCWPRESEQFLCGQSHPISLQGLHTEPQSQRTGGGETLGKSPFRDKIRQLCHGFLKDSQGGSREVWKWVMKQWALYFSGMLTLTLSFLVVLCYSPSRFWLFCNPMDYGPPGSSV